MSKRQRLSDDEVVDKRLKLDDLEEYDQETWVGFTSVVQDSEAKHLETIEFDPFDDHVSNSNASVLGSWRCKGYIFTAYTRSNEQHEKRTTIVFDLHDGIEREIPLFDPDANIWSKRIQRMPNNIQSTGSAMDNPGCCWISFVPNENLVEYQEVSDFVMVSQVERRFCLSNVDHFDWSHFRTRHLLVNISKMMARIKSACLLCMQNDLPTPLISIIIEYVIPLYVSQIPQKPAIAGAVHCPNVVKCYAETIH